MPHTTEELKAAAEDIIQKYSTALQWSSHNYVDCVLRRAKLLAEHILDTLTEQPSQSSGYSHTDHHGRPMTYWGGLAAENQREAPVVDEIPMKMPTGRLLEAIEAVTQIRLMIWRQNAQGEGFGCIKEYGEDIILALHELISRREAIKPVSISLEKCSNAAQDAIGVNSQLGFGYFRLARHVAKAVLEAAEVKYEN